MRPQIILLLLGMLAIVLLGGLASRSDAAAVLLVAAILATGVGFVLAVVNADTRHPVTLPPTPRAAAQGVLLNLGVAVLLNVGLTLVILWARGDLDDRPSDLQRRLLQYLSVGFFAGAVGFSELIGRYRDDPGRLLRLMPAGIYVWINVAAGVFALALIQQFEVLASAPQPPVEPAPAAAPPAPPAESPAAPPADPARPATPSADRNLAIKEALLAAFGAIAFFRTSFFTTKIGDKEVGIGPSALLKTFLDSCDRLVNRDQAVLRAKAIDAWMKDVDFEKAKSALPSLCLVLFEGLDADEQQALGEQVKKLEADTSMPPGAKAKVLGAHLLRQVGSVVVEEAIRALGDKITHDKPAPPPVTPLAEPADPAP